MQLINRAVIKSQDERIVNLSLFRIQPKVFRWITADGNPWDGVDYVERNDAIRALRVTVENDPDYIRSDLTVLPVEPPPEERAAVRINKLVSSAIDDFFEMSGEDNDIDPSAAIAEIAEIIRQETGTAELIEHVNVLVAYCIQRIRSPRPAGLDMAQAGLIINVLEVLEKVQREDYSNLKKSLTEGTTSVKVYSAMPPTGGVTQ